MRSVILMLALAGLGAVAQAKTAPAVPANGAQAFQAEILNTHNGERRRLGIHDLEWSDDLARDAARWAAHLAKTGKFQHDSQRARGENIWMSRAGTMTPTRMVQGWLAERANFIPGARHPKASKTGNWADVGHYSAIVWTATKKVGCAQSRGATHDFLVCRYDPRGNVAGYTAYDPARAKQALDAAAKAAEAAKAGKAR